MRMKPEGPGGISHIIVDARAFMEWVKNGDIETVIAATIKWRFYESIVYSYEVPEMIRTDGGAEFKGEFCSYL